MSTAQAIDAATVSETASPGMRTFFNWLVGGWRLFLRAPARLIGLMVLLFAIEVLVQAGIPALGIPVSKWVLGVLGGVCWLALDQLDTGGRLRLLDAVKRVGHRWPALVVLALLSPFVYLMQVGVGLLVLGPGAIDLLVLANPNAGVAASSWELGLILSAGIPFSTLLMFASPLLLIEGMPAGRSVVASVRLVVGHAAPMGLLALLTMMLVFLAPATLLLSVLITGPWLLCVGLAAFREVARRSRESAWR